MKNDPTLSLHYSAFWPLLVLSSWSMCMNIYESLIFAHTFVLAPTYILHKRAFLLPIYGLHIRMASDVSG